MFSFDNCPDEALTKDLNSAKSRFQSMADTSMFRGAIDFLGQIGIYDVVLPFLLTFTIVYAILEKTKILGMERVENKEYTKKNLNAMVAFVLAFFVVASTQLVSIINQTMGQIVLLLMLSLSFLLLVGSFHSDDPKGYFLQKGSWTYTTFMIIMFAGVMLIFLNAVGWLDTGYTYLKDHWDSNVVAAGILIIFIVLFMVFVTKDRKIEKEDKK